MALIFPLLILVIAYILVSLRVLKQYERGGGDARSANSPACVEPDT